MPVQGSTDVSTLTATPSLYGFSLSGMRRASGAAAFHLEQLEKGQRLMSYLDDARARLLELFDAQLPKDKIRERVAALFAEEVRRSFWNGAQDAMHKSRQLQVKR